MSLLRLAEGLHCLRKGSRDCRKSRFHIRILFQTYYRIPDRGSDPLCVPLPGNLWPSCLLSDVQLRRCPQHSSRSIQGDQNEQSMLSSIQRLSRRTHLEALLGAAVVASRGTD